MINGTAVYALWLREMKKFLRSKSKIIGSFLMPLFALVFMSFVFNNTHIHGMGKDVDYTSFLVPGIIGMIILFSSTTAGISMLLEREFGFLKEIMVTPVNRVSIVLGRITSGISTSLIRGIIILGISIIMGFKISGVIPFLLSIVFMLLISTTFIGLGLILASNMRDLHGFRLVMKLVTYPIFFFSGALFPLGNLPSWLRSFSYLDPLTYGIDGLRGALIEVSSFPVVLNMAVMVGFSLITILLGTYFFEKSESV